MSDSIKIGDIFYSFDAERESHTGKDITYNNYTSDAYWKMQPVFL